jgi:hypothetical protein
MMRHMHPYVYIYVCACVRACEASVLWTDGAIERRNTGYMDNGHGRV